MAGPKPLLIPWLIEQIDSGKYPGVCWTNKERTEFCIPWKHGLRQDSSDDDVRIFKAWAEMSGGASADPTVWKRNFRCALRIKGCEKIADNKNDTANPHKVFRLPMEEQRKRNQKPVLTASGGQALGFQSPMLPFDNLPEDMAIQGVDGLPSAMDKNGLEHCLVGLNIYEPQQAVMQPTEVMSAVVIPEQQHSNEEPMAIDPDMQRLEDLLSTMSTTMVNNTPSTSFRVSAYYRGVKVLEQQVENHAGFKVVYRPENMESDPKLATICLPRTDQTSISEETQARLTLRILNKLGDGLMVWVDGPALYGMRRGGSKIYWSLCKFERSSIPQEVKKEEPQILYTMTDFIQGLIDFMNGGGESPSFSLFFCLGEKWPDPEHKPWEKKLIMMEVVISVCEILKSLAVAGGASSLQSDQLQISGNSSLMDILEHYKDRF